MRHMPPRTNRLANANGDVGLGGTLLGVGETDVGEQVAAPLLDLNPLPHGLPLLSEIPRP